MGSAPVGETGSCPSGLGHKSPHTSLRLTSRDCRDTKPGGSRWGSAGCGRHSPGAASGQEPRPSRVEKSLIPPPLPCPRTDPSTQSSFLGFSRSEASPFPVVTQPRNSAGCGIPSVGGFGAWYPRDAALGGSWGGGISRQEMGDPRPGPCGCSHLAGAVLGLGTHGRAKNWEL